MATDQFVGQLGRDRGQIALALFFEQQRKEDDLEKHVAELVAHRRCVADAGGFGQLVGLLDRMRDDRTGVLLAVPGAFDPQCAGHLVEARESGGQVPTGHALMPLPL